MDAIFVAIHAACKIYVVEDLFRCSGFVPENSLDEFALPTSI